MNLVGTLSHSWQPWYDPLDELAAPLPDDVYGTDAED